MTKTKVIFLNIRIFFITTLLLPITAAYGEQHQHSMMGFHGMVMFADNNEQLYISHLPLYAHPHDYQLIYKVSTSDNGAVVERLAKSMVTLLPAKFDLTRLIKQDNFAIEAQLFQGHFERGGEKVADIKVSFEQAVLIEQIKPSAKRAQANFYLVKVNEQQTLWAHQIQSAPSFDAIGFTDNTLIYKSFTSVDCQQPTALTIYAIENITIKCGLSKPVYVETRDFNE